tara:strand:- start:162 stop:1019 length:858 start_codon:yes stop_codon:yes gene_type:complete
MNTVNSLSGGQTSAYIAAHYPADYNIFALVRTDDKKCLFPDKKIRNIVEDKIQKPFIGTLEENAIIYTMLDLEQYIGKKIDWCSGRTFDEIIVRSNGKKYLPNVVQRFCTTEMKLQPIFDWWNNKINKPIEMRIGFRANEQKRMINMINKTNKNGLLEFKTITGKSKNGKRNKWSNVEWQKPIFPLINPPIYKDKIVKFWKDKPVRFAYLNNCVGCFHRNPILLKHLSNKHPNKFQWFIDAEKDSANNIRTFKNGMTYEDIKKSFKQTSLFDEDFSDCDSGYCGL